MSTKLHFRGRVTVFLNSYHRVIRGPVWCSVQFVELLRSFFSRAGQISEWCSHEDGFEVEISSG